MEVAFLVLGLIALLGTYSLYRNGQKNRIINGIINDYLVPLNGTLVDTERPTFSGPFKDDYYDRQGQNLYANLGYSPSETVYRIVTYRVKDGSTHCAWVQIRIERLKATYVDWKVA